MRLFTDSRSLARKATSLCRRSVSGGTGVDANCQTANISTAPAVTVTIITPRKFFIAVSPGDFT